MKDCKNCEYYEGYDRESGYPICQITDEDGICPYQKEGRITETGLKVTVDMGEVGEYLSHTLENSLEKQIKAKIDQIVSETINETYRKNIREMTEEAMQKQVREQVDEFMKGDITIGGGWKEPQRSLTRAEYMSEIIQESLTGHKEKEYFKQQVQVAVKDQVERYNRALKQEINSNLKTMFDEVTRKTLSDSVVQMLMCNDTYQRLANGMQNLLK